MYVSKGLDGPGKGKASGIYRLNVPYTVEGSDDLVAPKLEVSTDEVYAIVAGGTTAGKADPTVLVLLNDTMLMHRSVASGGKLVIHPLPMHFAQPVVTAWQPAHAPGTEGYILGPMTHDRTVSLAVSPADSSLVAVTGWTTIYDNTGAERVWLSSDAGAHFTDVTARLRNATATIGQWRPSALLLLPLPAKKTTALLVGTVHGVFVSFVSVSYVFAAGTRSTASAWVRLGTCAELPQVLVAGLSHEPKDDTLVAATMGRGVFVVPGATKELEAAYVRMSSIN
jgi:hypothetical protein